MGFPLFRFTLSNVIEGSLVISEPGGWDESKLVLLRSKEFYAVNEQYEQPLTFYGTDGQNYGGVDWIRNIEQTQGLDAQIGILIEISNDYGETYETVFEAVEAVETVKETDFYKIEAGVTPNALYQKFLNRRDQQCDLQATTDFEGNVITPTSIIGATLSSQSIQKRFERTTQFTPFPDPGGNSGDDEYFLIFTNELNEIDEITNRLEYGNNVSTSNPKSVSKYIYKVTDYGNYRVQVRPVFFLVFSSSVTYDVRWYFQYGEDSSFGLSAPQQIGATVAGTGATAEGLLAALDETISLVPGDVIYIWGEVQLSGNRDIQFFSDFFSGTLGADVYTLFSIDAETTYPESTAQLLGIRNVLANILTQYTGIEDCLVSDYLTGCGGNYAIGKGVHYRGYTLAQKKFFHSFNDWWAGADPILGLGLCHELGGSPEEFRIRVEQRSFFFNRTPSLYLDFINNVERSYDLDRVFSSIEIGFEKWQAEAFSGIDDPQTKRTWNTRFKTLGKQIKVLSKWIGASLGIEQTRRNRATEGKDWRWDEETLITAMNGSIPELDENFVSIANLLYSATRYNVRLGVARNFERLKSTFNGCLQWYIGEEYKFASGEGNYTMQTRLENTDCEGTDASPEPIIEENGDSEITDDFLCMPVVYTFTHPLTWEQYKTMRDNKNNAIAISRTDSDHIIVFIDEVEYEITHGRANFKVVLGENAYL